MAEKKEKVIGYTVNRKTVKKLPVDKPTKK